VLLLLSGIGVVVWTAAGLPPVRMVLRYGFSYHPEPTGQVKQIEGIEFVEIGPGCFLMGSEQRSKGGDQPKPSNEMPVHWVEFPRGFFIARTEVTNAQYEAFDPKHQRSGSSPWNERGEYSQGDRDSVVDVSWEDARKYCAWLSEKSGQAIRLPAESEWECACRAGSKREFCFGDDEKLLTRYGWYDANSDGRAHQVGTRRANAWGLHDLHGNVLEWCEDTYHENYEGAPADGTAWTEKGTPRRVFRGGSWFDGAEDCRSAGRGRYLPGYRYGHLGFRPSFSPLDP
jgi:formylglycine-generating enzyme required for sulfatase activity